MKYDTRNAIPIKCDMWNTMSWSAGDNQGQNRDVLVIYGTHRDGKKPNDNWVMKETFPKYKHDKNISFYVTALLHT